MTENVLTLRPATAFVHRKGARTTPPDARYIGRGSPYGNPFVIGRDGDRDVVCNRFERETLPSLDLRPLICCHLVCFCAPLRCHGHAIVSAIVAQLARDSDPRLEFYRLVSAPDLFSHANETQR